MYTVRPLFGGHWPSVLGSYWPLHLLQVALTTATLSCMELWCNSFDDSRQWLMPLLVVMASTSISHQCFATSYTGCWWLSGYSSRLHSLHLTVPEELAQHTSSTSACWQRIFLVVPVSVLLDLVIWSSVEPQQKGRRSFSVTVLAT